MHQNSLDAYEEIRAIKTTCRRKVHEVILERKAITAKEIARKLGWEINCVTPRIVELKKLGSVVEGGTVEQDGFRATLYAPVDRGGII